jgi:hypothetical protein
MIPIGPIESIGPIGVIGAIEPWAHTAQGIHSQ